MRFEKGFYMLVVVGCGMAKKKRSAHRHPSGRISVQRYTRTTHEVRPHTRSYPKKSRK